MKTTLVQVMTWNQTDNKPLPEVMMFEVTEAYIYIYMALGLNIVVGGDNVSQNHGHIL